MILSHVKLNPAFDTRQAILDALRFVFGQTRPKRGCMDCAVQVAQDCGQAIIYNERWQTREDLDRHIRSDAYLCILAAMELSCEKPEISFHEVSETRSMELVERLRV